MKLLTKEVIASLPPLYSQEKVKDPVVPVKFFSPLGSWTWYAYEGQPEGDDFIFFGYVVGHENELGYFSLKELESVGPFGLGIERDLHWRPKKLSEVKKLYER